MKDYCMRIFVVFAIAAVLSTDCWAAQTGPLPPGKPAGLHKAQSRGQMLWGALGAAAVIGAAVLIAENESSTSTTMTTQ